MRTLRRTSLVADAACVAQLVAGNAASAQASTLSVDYANAGVSAADTATCLHGGYA